MEKILGHLVIGNPILGCLYKVLSIKAPTKTQFSSVFDKQSTENNTQITGDSRTENNRTEQTATTQHILAKTGPECLRFLPAKQH